MHQILILLLFRIPITTPPYILESNLSVVKTVILLNIFSKIFNSVEKVIVPINAFAKKRFPTLKKAIINRGIFIIIVVVPIFKSNK